MWKTFITENGAYYMINVLNESDNIYSILFTDFKSIWSRQLTGVQIAKLFSDCNPIAEMKLEDAVSKVLEILQEINDANLDVEFKEQVVHVNVTKKEHIAACDIPVKYSLKLELIPEENEKFKEMITIPMIQTISYMEKQQKMLLQLLLHKDKELDAYRHEKGILSREDLTTKPFDPSSICQSSNKLFLNVLSEKFVDHVSEAHGEVEEPALIVTGPTNSVKRKRRVRSKHTIKKKGVITYSNA